MIVSWKWLKDYVDLDMDQAELENRLAMSGLNHEETKNVAGDLAIDLEVTSNRADCLGHLGVAREVAVLWDKQLKRPGVELPQSSSTSVTDLTKVNLECPDLCYRYTARLIRGIKVGPSPDWLAERLETLGIAVINNIVDITNYVLMECGQPLHAFDFAKLGGAEIIVRPAKDGEEFHAIDHRTYKLDRNMCVIADAKVPVALGGVMGGADTEISADTTDLLIEAAEFDPVSTRNTARKLRLFSDSSYRFERGVDPEAVDWASRRCCQLVLELAGGELAGGVIDVGRDPPPRSPVVLRLSQLPRVLGINVEPDEVRRILGALGCDEQNANTERVEVVPPSWRRDLTREIDLIEEVARIHGYDKIPEDVSVPMAPSHRTDEDRVISKVREVLVAAGFDEVMTVSVVPAEWSSAFSPWSNNEPLESEMPLKPGDIGTREPLKFNLLRRSLIPSLLEARRINESLSVSTIELFETAQVYLPQENGLPTAPKMLGIASGHDFLYLKGVIENLVLALKAGADLQMFETEQPLLDPHKSCELQVGGQRLGFLGEVSTAGGEQFNLRSRTTIAELDLRALESVANLIPQYSGQSQYPATSRDFNFILDEAIRWSDLSSTVREAGGDLVEKIDYRETFRDAKRDGPGKKRVLLAVTFRAPDRTLTGEEAEQTSQAIVSACAKTLDGKLLG